MKCLSDYFLITNRAVVYPALLSVEGEPSYNPLKYAWLRFNFCCKAAVRVCVGSNPLANSMTCVAIRLRVKSEGMSNTLFTMELTSNSFIKMSDFEVYRLPWLPYMRHSYMRHSLRPFKWGITWAGLRIHHVWAIKCVDFLENPKILRLQNVSLLLWKPDRIILISHVVQIQDMCDYQTTCKKWRNF